MGRDDPKYKAHKCKLCGKVEQPYYMEEVRKRLVEQQICFTCDYWMIRVRRIQQRGNKAEVVIIQDEERGPICFCICPEDPEEKVFRGFGGRRFRIRYKDGTIVTTTNLWHNGVVPENFRHLLPVNAEFA